MIAFIRTARLGLLLIPLALAACAEPIGNSPVYGPVAYDYPGTSYYYDYPPAPAPAYYYPGRTYVGVNVGPRYYYRKNRHYDWHYWDGRPGHRHGYDRRRHGRR